MDAETRRRQHITRLLSVIEKVSVATYHLNTGDNRPRAVEQYEQGLKYAINELTLCLNNKIENP